MSFLTPAAFAVAGLALPLLVLYMLRTRRHRTDVPSVLLWERAGVAVTSAVPWQRLVITPLLIAQLVIIGLFATTLAHPYTAERSLLGPHTVFVMDTSGSMAMDGRLDAAKTEALHLLDGAPDGTLISVVDAGPHPTILAALVRDNAHLREIIGSLRPGGGMEDLPAAITLARSLATPDRPTSILLLSDGGIAELSTLEEPVIGVEQILFPQRSDNLAITAFTGEPAEDGSFRVFLEVSNFGDTDRDVQVLVETDQTETPIDLSVDAQGRARDGRRIDVQPGSVVTATLRDADGAPLHDGITLDNTAALTVGANTTATVGVVGEDSLFVDALIKALPAVEPADDASAEMLIVDATSAEDLPAPAWLIRPTTPPEGVTISGTVQNTAASFQRPGEPLLAGVDLSDLVVGEADIVDAPDWLPLVKAGDVPLILIGEADGHRAVYFTFDLNESNLPVQVAFPLLGARIIDWLGGSGAVATGAEPAGTPINVAPPSGWTATVTDPTGGRHPATAVLYEATDQPGVYTVTYTDPDGVEHPGPTVVRSFVPAESAGLARTLDTAPFGADGEDTALSIHEWAPTLLGVLLALILLEWWIGHGMPRPRRHRTTGEGATS